MIAHPSPIEHVVVLMLENRSFDHMLGLLPGVNGLLDADGRVDARHFNLAKPSDPTSQRYPAGPGAPYAIDPRDTGGGFGGPSHSYPAASLQTYGDKNGPSADLLSRPAPLSGFVSSYVGELASIHRKDPSEDEIRVPMAAFEPGRLPVFHRLAQEFCVCDQWYSEVPGPTQPNRLFVHAATATGFSHNVWDHAIQARTIYEELDAAGRDWAFFYFDLSDSNSFPQLKSRTDRVLRFDAFYQQAKSGTLPAYSFLCPRYNDSTEPGERANSQHAPYDVRYGEHLVADVYEALRASPLWEKTLLVVTYDEHGGFYDHVPPPMEGVSNPDGLVSPTAFDQEQATKDPQKSGYLLEPAYRFDFKRLGMRVPTVLVSPWIERGKVDSTRYQHTSILATLHDLFGTRPLTARDAEAKSFAGLLSAERAPRRDAPLTLERPPLPPDDQEEALSKPLTERQADMWPMLKQLDGHPDSGKDVPPPPTRREAHLYLEERLAAHERHHESMRRGA